MSAGMTRAVRVAVVLIVAALVPSLFVLIAGHNPWRVLTTLLLYAFGPQGWSEVLVHAIPLTLIGLGVAFALRAGLFNIGADGQLIAGAVLAVFFAPYFEGWGIAGLIVFLILGSIGGAALGALVGYLRAWFGASEIIVTIMLNYVMVQMISYLIRGPMQETSKFWPQSYLIPDDCILPVIVQGTRLHAGLFVALLMVLVGAVVQRRTVLGFVSSVLGANPGAAAYAGFRVKILTVIVMAISGGLAGLAGAVEVGGIYQRLQDNMSEGFRPCRHRCRVDRAARGRRHSVCRLSVWNFLRRLWRASAGTGAALPAGVDHRGLGHFCRCRAAMGAARPKGDRLMDALFITALLAATIRLGMAIGLAAIGEAAVRALRHF